MPDPVESGLRNSRIEWVAESNVGEPPSDPAWNRYSDVVTGITWPPTPNIDEQRGLGSVDPQDFFGGPEDHTLTISYFLQQAIASDALNDGLTRDNDNELPNSHTIVERSEVFSGGNDGGGIRTYTVALGAYIDEASLPGNPDQGNPIEVQLSYIAEKVRSYEFHQPSSSDTVDLVSTDDADTMDATIEGKDGGTAVSETISLNGTTTVTTTQTFDEIDVIWLASDPAGDVTASLTTSGATIETIHGSATYGGIEGDRGVPPLGAGSHASAVSGTYERFLDDSVERPGGTDLGEELQSTELVVSNNIDAQARVGTMRRRLTAGPRNITLTAQVFGISESHDKLMQALQVEKNDIVWKLTNSTLTITGAALDEPGERGRTPDDAVMQVGNTFTGDGLTIA